MQISRMPSSSEKVDSICSRMQSSWPSPAVEGAASSQLHFSAILPCTVQAPYSTALNVKRLYAGPGRHAEGGLLTLPRQRWPPQTRRGQLSRRLEVSCLRSGAISNYNKTAP